MNPRIKKAVSQIFKVNFFNGAYDLFVLMSWKSNFDGNRVAWTRSRRTIRMQAATGPCKEQDNQWDSHTRPLHSNSPKKMHRNHHFKPSPFRMQSKKFFIEGIRLARAPFRL